MTLLGQKACGKHGVVHDRTVPCPDCEAEREQLRKEAQQWSSGELTPRGWVAAPERAPKAGPSFGVAMLITDPEMRSLLLGVRNKEPHEGKWVLPGGGVRWGESIADAAERAVREETGIAFDFRRTSIIADGNGRPFEVLEVLGDDEHRVILVYRGTYRDGLLKSGSDLKDVAWVPIWKVPGLDLSPVVRSLVVDFCETLR